MQELGVSPDTETLSNYVLPVFPSIEEARKALMVIYKWGCVFTCGWCSLKCFVAKKIYSSFFRMPASLWIQRASCAQRFAYWLGTTWPNYSPCVSTHSHTLAHTPAQSKKPLLHPEHPSSNKSLLRLRANWPRFNTRTHDHAHTH